MSDPYRVPHESGEPAPFWDGTAYPGCPGCGMCPAMLYSHVAGCWWLAAYYAANRRMQPRPIDVPLPRQSFWSRIFGASPT